MSTTLVTAGFVAAEKIIARALVYDPSSAQKIKALAPQVLKLNVSTTADSLANPFTVFICFTESGIELKNYYEQEVAATISGDVISLVKLFQSDVHHLKDSGVRIEGKIGFIQELSELANSVDLDWEELLCQIFGDLIGPQIAAAARQHIKWSRDRVANIARLTEEYLTHESKRVLGKAELENFYQDINQLTIATEKIQRKINQLKDKIIP